MKTKEELSKLKSSWLEDPIWDLEWTEGFEDHYEELLSFRKQRENEWQQKENEWQKRKYLARLNEKCKRLGIEGNHNLMQYLEMLEFQIEDLRRELEVINQ